jgi:hypothetical protein
MATQTFFASIGNQIGNHSDEIVAARSQSLIDTLCAAMDATHDGDFTVWSIDDETREAYEVDEAEVEALKTKWRNFDI